jgi:hypothetical protein
MLSTPNGITITITIFITMIVAITVTIVIIFSITITITITRYELKEQGKLNLEDVGSVTDVYQRNENLDDQVKSYE